ncbi:disease resistance protein RML1A-like [Vigna radiata var. radiata]|uniref:Disease resistance protein RML1A-like n=1 Tax=Vigna radiata var. radiata TaxID=3916 RepID=A0A1S3VDK8_VIGRR|nr:disease resistance protein RML1A-like [Vigna radiata var. radiata]
MQSVVNPMFFQVSHKIKYVAFICLVFVTSSVTSNDTSQIKYDVFVSFRGEDVRRGFLSHLIEAFSQKQIAFFVDDSILKGEELSEALFGAIEESYISLVIFSENYASSRWCLSELEKIMECRRKNGQTVVPIFYKVDPSDIRHQRRTYGDAFIKHERNYSLATVQTWRSALSESANLSGFDLSKFPDEAELVKRIVKFVWSTLNHVHQVNSKGLVGIGKRIAQVESLLQLETKDVRMIGIWGMGGIGKTTIAQEVYNKLCFKYDSCCFLANIREESWRHGINSLKEKLFSTLLREEHLKIGRPDGFQKLVERRFHRMKVLIILDDVGDAEQLENLARTNWFGCGSRIIVTTRDKQVLAEESASVYHVEALNFDESLRLFNLNAFKQKHTEAEYEELSKKAVEYAKGIPFVLKVLGHRLHGKDREIWESELERQEVHNKRVHDIIKSSYYDLEEDEKRIFLDIACFFYGQQLQVKYIDFLLKDRDYSVPAGLERLKDKAFISISQENTVSMHDIIQETAWQIAGQESIENPRRSQIRLFVPDDIYEVLTYNKGNEAIRSIVVNLLRIKQLHLKPQVFTKMSKLHFLNIYTAGTRDIRFYEPWGLYLHQGLQSLPNELRYLGWMHYPLESLPSNFSAENLVELHLPYSRVKKLWHEVPDLVNLKVLMLYSSSNIKELPDFSRAPNLEVIDLRSCVGLTSVHPSVFSLKKLEKLDLDECRSLTSLRSNVQMESLRYLSLFKCMELKDFSVTSKNMIMLNLENTDIKQLPSSFGSQSKLEDLNLAFSSIESLPADMKDLKGLQHLDLRHCRNLSSLPELPPSIETLDCRECVSLGSVTFPSIAEQWKENKKKVVFWNCLNLDERSLKAIETNARINMVKFAHRHLSTSGDAHAIYVYPGSQVPEWLTHKTTHDDDDDDDGDDDEDSITFAPNPSHLGYIFCLILPAVQYSERVLKLTVSTEGEDEGDSMIVYLDRPHHTIKFDHVYLMYNEACSRFLTSRAKQQPMLKIKVTVATLTLSSKYTEVQLRGFGVSTISNFLQKRQLYDTPIPMEHSEGFPDALWNR